MVIDLTLAAEHQEIRARVRTCVRDALQPTRPATGGFPL